MQNPPPMLMTIRKWHAAACIPLRDYAAWVMNVFAQAAVRQGSDGVSDAAAAATIGPHPASGHVAAVGGASWAGL